ncbi:MAG: oligosaccharide flippase family protein [Candidatus Sericytochromatia bacterium]|nr:oligosaccharide flippase family protein [Candidatus Sericytochromatia bacterium]
MAALVARYCLLMPLSIVSSVLLARWLSVQDFGVFTSVTFLVFGIGSLFELGLISVLIQQPEPPTVAEQRTVFTVYLAFFAVLALLLMLSAPWLALVFRLPNDGSSLLRWMTLPMLLGALGSVPTVMLERSLRFGSLAAVEVSSTFLEKLVTLVLAYQGFGFWSFLWGTLAAVGLRMSLLNICSPWSFGLAWDGGVLRHRMAQGMWFQGVNLAHMARENLHTLVAGPTCGPHAVGLLNWSTNLATLVPANALMLAHRVTFTAYARLQHDHSEAGAVLRATLRRLWLFTAPPMSCLWVLADPLVRFVYGEVWLEALPVLFWALIRAWAGQLFSPLLVFINARGQAALGFRFILASTLLEWTLAMAFLAFMGYRGLAVGAALGSIGPAIVMAVYVNRTASLKPIATLAPGLALASGLVAVSLLMAPLVTSWQTLLGAIMILALLWVLVVGFLERCLIVDVWARLRGRFLRNAA